MGYHRAGFEVTGMDIKHGKRYPFKYIRKDVMELRPEDLEEYDLIHASPPCQTYSIRKALHYRKRKRRAVNRSCTAVRLGVRAKST